MPDLPTRSSSQPTTRSARCRSRSPSPTGEPPELPEVVEERDAVRDEEHRDGDRVARQVPLDDVRPALRGGREAHAAHAGFAAAVHEDERDEHEDQQYLDD